MMTFLWCLSTVHGNYVLGHSSSGSPVSIQSCNSLIQAISFCLQFRHNSLSIQKFLLVGFGLVRLIVAGLVSGIKQTNVTT
jgi:hypothetical protein